MSLLNTSKHEPRKNHSTNKSTPRIQLIVGVTKRHKKIELFFFHIFWQRKKPETHRHQLQILCGESKTLFLETFFFFMKMLNCKKQ